MKIFLREIIFSIVLTLVLIFILSVAISQTNVSENIIVPAVIAITGVSLMLGAFRISKFKKEKGILNGTILGLVYMFILYIISSFVNFEFSLTITSIIMIILGILGGVIGGILGVNF